MLVFNSLKPFKNFFDFFLSLFTFLPAPLGPFVSTVISIVFSVFIINLFLKLIGSFWK